MISTVSRNRWGTFVKDVSVFNEEDYWEKTKKRVLQELGKLQSSVAVEMENMLQEALGYYNDIIQKKMETRKRFLKNVLEKEATNKEYEEVISKLNKELKDIKDEIQDCSKIVGEL